MPDRSESDIETAHASKPTSASRTCESCGFENPAIMRFCGGCGKPLAAAPVIDGSMLPTIGARHEEDTGERRQITVMFCDLVGSTRLSEELDPEELRELVRAYQVAAEEVVGRYEGHVAQYLGDGILVYFGYPRAHEDDPWRGVSAALGIIEAMRALNDRRERGPRIAVRIGVHTGFGVAGDVGGKLRKEQLVIGRAPNVAARLQGLADEGTVVVSDDTRRLTEGFFDFHPLGARELKGISESIGVHRVLAPSDVHDRFEVARNRGLTPFLGRRAELERLQSLFGTSREGRGQGALLVAEPGLGKSRLVHELVRTAGDALIIDAHCTPHSQNDAFWPVIDLLRRLLAFERGDSSDAKLAKLDARLADLGLSGDEVRPLLVAFLGLPAPAGSAPLAMSPQRQREATMRVVVQLIVAHAAKRPVLVLFEDLHWADLSTLELVGRLLEASAAAPMLTLLTARPTFTSPFGERANLTRLELQRLSDVEVGEIVLGLTGGRPLPASVMQVLVEKTDGVPLFVEELTKVILERGLVVERDGRYELLRPQDVPSIPATLRDSLTARLDLLGPAKEAAQLASAIGRRFSWDLLAAISPRDGLFLRRQLSQLLAAELILLDEAPGPGENYVFKHALVQEAAHESMLKARRKDIHGRIARRILADWPEVADDRPELLAGHFEEAGQIEDAVQYLHRAGQRDMQRCAHAEALAHFGRGITLLEALPEAARYRRELELRISMSGSLIATRGYCAPELEQSSIRARKLCALLDNPPELFPVLYTLWVINLASSRRAQTDDYARQLLELVKASPNQMLELSAYFANGNTFFYEGRREEAWKMYGEALARYSPDQHLALARVYGDDHGLYAMTYVAYLELYLGEVTRAKATEAKYLGMAEGWGDPLAIALALASAATLRRDMRDADRAMVYADRLVAISTEQGFPFWAALAFCVRGWVRASRGEAKDGITEIQQGLAFFDLIGQKLPLTYYLALLGEAQLFAGEHEQALATVDRALGLAATNVDAFYVPDLLRLKGELLFARDPSSTEAKESFEAAVAVSETTAAPYFALRAAVGLVRTRRDPDEKRVARARLAKIVAALPEQADVPDVVEAKALLAELS